VHIFQSKKIFLGLKQFDLELCEHYVYGKQKRVRLIGVGKENKNEKLSLVHTYVWVLAQVSSLGGSNYYVTLLMIQLEKLGFIAFIKSQMFVIILRNGKIWLRMRQERS
jgi:hypothetical protein